MGDQPCRRRIRRAGRPVSCDRLSRDGSAWGGKSGAVAASDTASSGFRARHPHLDPGPLPRFEHHDALHEPTLIAAARSQMTASSPRGTFSQAELAGDRVITRCITRSAVSARDGCQFTRSTTRPLPGHGLRATTRAQAGSTAAVADGGGRLSVHLFLRGQDAGDASPLRAVRVGDRAMDGVVTGDDLRHRRGPTCDLGHHGLVLDNGALEGFGIGSDAAFRAARHGAGSGDGSR
jgi:hypothetical protein